MPLYYPLPLRGFKAMPTIDQMPTKGDKSKRKDSRKPSRMVRVPLPIAEAFDQLAEDNMSSIGAEVTRALREYLEKISRWPRRPSPG